MAMTHEELKQLLVSPRGALDFQVKRWVDPAQPDGIAKIAKPDFHAFAMPVRAPPPKPARL